MNSERFKRALEPALERDDTLLLSAFERSTSNPFKYEVKVNTLKLLQQDAEAYDFLLGRFSSARRLLSELIFETCSRNAKKATSEYFSAHTPHYFNCCFKLVPSPRLLEIREYQQIGLDGQYEYEMDELRRGQLLMVNSALVIEVNEPEKYTFYWELRCPFCQRTVEDSQSLIQVLSGRSRGKSTFHYCEECKMEVDMIKSAQKCFECQKTTVLIESEKESPPTYRKKVVYLDWNQVGKLAVGDYVDMLCYYELEPVLQQPTKEGQPSQVLLNQIFACESFECSSNQSNWPLLMRDSFEMVRSHSPTTRGLDLEALHHDYQSLIRSIRSFEFAACREKLTALKLAVLASVLLNGSSPDWQTKRQEMRLAGREGNIASWNALNLFVVTEEVWLVRRAMILPGLVYKFWPSLRTKDSMRQFMLSCHGSIVIVSNPSFEDIPFLTDLLKGRIIYKNKEVPVKATVWVVMDEAKCQTEKTNRATLELMDYFDIVLRVNFEKRLTCSEPELHQNILHFVDQYARRYVNGRPSPAQESSIGSSSHNSSQMSQDGPAIVDFPEVLLRKYYTASRVNCSIAQRDLLAMQKVAEGIRLLRYHCVVTPAHCRQLALIDVIFAILFNEQRFRNVYKGVDKFRTQLSVDATRLLLNDSDRFQVKEIVDGDTLQAQLIERRRSYFFKMWIDELSRFVDLPVE